MLLEILHSSHYLGLLDWVFHLTLETALSAFSPSRLSGFMMLCLFILTAAYLHNLLKIHPYHHTNGFPLASWIFFLPLLDFITHSNFAFNKSASCLKISISLSYTTRLDLIDHPFWCSDACAHLWDLPEAPSFFMDLSGVGDGIGCPSFHVSVHHL